MAKRGRPPKAGKRKPCGRLSPFDDPGNPMVLERRAELVGELHKHSRFADSVIGRLYLAQEFGGDEIAELRHRVLTDYAEYQRRLYGPGSAQSAMRDLDGSMRGRSLAGDDTKSARKFKTWYLALLSLKPAPGCRFATNQVVERAASYEIAPATAAELETLVKAADRLIAIRGLKPRKGKRHALPPGRRNRDLLAIYSREVFGPSDEQLAEALSGNRHAAGS